MEQETEIAETDKPAQTALFKRPKRRNPAASAAARRPRAQSSDSEHEDNDKGSSTTTASELMRRKKAKLSSSKLLAAASSSTKHESAASTLTTAFESSGTAASLAPDMATRTLDIDGADDTDPSQNTSADASSAAYRGIAGYNEYVNKRVDKPNQSSAGGIRAGPLRGPTNVRISARFDYQSDICKDYKETGYCGYGDSCKFLHDRGDYKAGWQIDREWDEQQRRKQSDPDPNRFLIDSDDDADAAENKPDDSIDVDDDLPFACLICRKSFTDPIVTKCQHYFCESCALKNYAKTAKCFACGANTDGVFNVAKDLIARLEIKKKRMAELEAEIKASNQDENEEEENENEEEENNE